MPLLKQQQPEPVTGVRVTRRSTPRPAPPAVTTATPPSTTTRAPPPPPSIPEASTTSETIFYDFKPREGYIDNDRAESVNNFVNSIYSALSPTSRSPPPPSGNTFYQAVGDSSKSYSPSTTNIKQRPSPPIPTYGGRPTPFSSSSYSSSSSSSTINNQRPIGTRSGSVSSSTSYPAVPSISSYGSPHGTPISASSSSSTSSSRSAFRPASPTYFRGAGTTTGAIWTNQPPQYHQGNVQQVCIEASSRLDCSTRQRDVTWLGSKDLSWRYYGNYPSSKKPQKPTTDFSLIFCLFSSTIFSLLKNKNCAKGTSVKVKKICERKYDLRVLSNSLHSELPQTRQLHKDEFLALHDGILRIAFKAPLFLSSLYPWAIEWW